MVHHRLLLLFYIFATTALASNTFLNFLDGIRPDKETSTSDDLTYHSMPNETTVAGTYIITLRSNITISTGWFVALQLAFEFLGMSISHAFSSHNAYIVTLPKDVPLPLASIKALPFIESIEEDNQLIMHQTQKPLYDGMWGLDAIDGTINKQYSFGKTGSGVHVYILDTTLLTTHAEFQGRADMVWSADGISGDCTGHATHVGGIVGGLNVGVAKNANIHSARVIGCDSSGSATGGTTSVVAQGIDYITQNAQHPAVINMSLGPSGTYVRSATLDAVIANALAKGITVIVAAGNDNTNPCNSSPAGTTGVITVGAVDSSSTRASFSNYGDCIDIWAPGVNILSSVPLNLADFKLQAYGHKEGTSQATPFVTGLAALLLEGLTVGVPATVKTQLLATSFSGVINANGGNALYARSSTVSDAKLVTLSPLGTVPGIGAPEIFNQVTIIIIVVVGVAFVIVCYLGFRSRKHINKKKTLLPTILYSESMPASASASNVMSPKSPNVRSSLLGPHPKSPYSEPVTPSVAMLAPIRTNIMEQNNISASSTPPTPVRAKDPHTDIPPSPASPAVASALSKKTRNSLFINANRMETTTKAGLLTPMSPASPTVATQLSRKVKDSLLIEPEEKPAWLGGWFANSNSPPGSPLVPKSPRIPRKEL